MQYRKLIFHERLKKFWPETLYQIGALYGSIMEQNRKDIIKYGFIEQIFKQLYDWS